MCFVRSQWTFVHQILISSSQFMWKFVPNLNKARLRQLQYQHRWFWMPVMLLQKTDGRLWGNGVKHTQLTVTADKPRQNHPSHYLTRVSPMNLQVSLTLCFHPTGGLKADIKEPTQGEQNLYWNGDERRVRGKLPAASHTLWSLTLNVRQMFRSLMWIYVDVRQWLPFINLSCASASHPLYI